MKTLISFRKAWECVAKFWPKEVVDKVAPMINDKFKPHLWNVICIGAPLTYDVDIDDSTVKCFSKIKEEK